jgi:hypothetical protein
VPLNVDKCKNVLFLKSNGDQRQMGNANAEGCFTFFVGPLLILLRISFLYCNPLRVGKGKRFGLNE